MTGAERLGHGKSTRRIVDKRGWVAVRLVNGEELIWALLRRGTKKKTKMKIEGVEMWSPAWI